VYVCTCGGVGVFACWNVGVIVRVRVRGCGGVSVGVGVGVCVCDMKHDASSKVYLSTTGVNRS